MDDHMTPSPVRHDRKSFVSLALHKAVRSRLDVDPDRVLELGIAGARKILPNVRGDAREMLYEWLRLLGERDISTVGTLLTEDSEHAAEMRNVAVFMGVLSQSERRSILDAVYERAEYER